MGARQVKGKARRGERPTLNLELRETNSQGAKMLRKILNNQHRTSNIQHRTTNNRQPTSHLAGAGSHTRLAVGESERGEPRIGGGTSMDPVGGVAQEVDGVPQAQVVFDVFPMGLDRLEAQFPLTGG